MIKITENARDQSMKNNKAAALKNLAISRNQVKDCVQTEVN